MPGLVVEDLGTLRLPLGKAQARKLTRVFSLAGVFDLRPLVDSYVNDAIGMTEAMAAS